MRAGLLARLLFLVTVGVSITLAAPQKETAGSMSGERRPALEKLVQPIYPAIAVSARVQGIVIVEATVGADGRTADARVMRSIPLLDQAALDAVRQWQFEPRADGGVGRRMITLHFVLNDPEMYPRPAQYVSPLTSWIPRNFAWTYRYECRGDVVAIDSIARSVDSGKRNAERSRTFSFAFDAQDAADVFVMLVAGGFFDPETVHRTWKERAEVVAGVQDGGDSIVVMVPAAAPPPPDVISVASAQYESSRPRRLDGHTLSVRQNDTWRVSDWSEPVGKKDTSGAAAMSSLGRRLREFVQKRLGDPRQLPKC